MASIYLDTIEIGYADLDVIDRSMGVLAGKVSFLPAYDHYRPVFQKITDEKGQVSSLEFPLKVITEKGIPLEAEGGISITDSPALDEKYIDIAGVDLYHPAIAEEYQF